MVKKYGFCIIAVIFGMITLMSVYSRYQDFAQKNRKIEVRMKQLAVENKAFIKRQYKLQNDPVFAESVARERLNVAQEGEVIYKILPDYE